MQWRELRYGSSRTTVLLKPLPLAALRLSIDRVIVNEAIRRRTVSDHKRPQRVAGFSYPCDSDSRPPGAGPVSPTPLSASHSGPWPLAETMARDPHE